MVKTLSPKDLREKAQKLLEKAKMQEALMYEQIGRLFEKELLSHRINDAKFTQVQTRVKDILYR